MRGEPERQMPLFHVLEVEDRIRPNHPLRDIKRRTDRILASLDDQFAKAYSHTGRPSVPLERRSRVGRRRRVSSQRRTRRTPRTIQQRQGSPADEATIEERSLSTQSDVSQEGGGVFWMVESGGGIRQEQSGRSMEAEAVTSDRSRRLQSGENGEVGSGNVTEK